MSKPLPFPSLTDDMISSYQKHASTKREFQRVQCLYLRQRGCNSSDISLTLSMSAVSVKRVWIDYRKRGEEALFHDLRGGRYNENMTKKEEDEFIQPFLKKAEKGGILTVGNIHRAYEKKMQRKIPKSTIYALLHRHGWRKIVPRTKHPKGNSTSQSFFKTSFPPTRSF